MFHALRRFAAFAVPFLVVSHAAANSADFGLRPIWEDPAAHLSELPMDERLAGIDVYDAPLARGETISTEDRIALIRLYRWSPLMKHRVLGIELLDGLEGTDRRREAILTYQRTFNPWKAMDVLEDWVEAWPEDVEAWIRIGIMRLEEGADDRRPGALEEALRAFGQAVSLDPGSLDGWRGLAVTRIAQQQYVQLADVAETLLALAPEAPGSHLVQALAMEACDSEHRASLAWDRAFAVMDPAMRAKFEDDERLRIYDPSSVYVDELVTPVPPRSERGWWARLTEAEALFARPGRGVHSWDTACGQAWLLFGRPEVMVFVTASDVAAVSADPRLSPYREAVLGQMGGGSSAQHANPDRWVWLVRISEDVQFPLVFQRETQFATWQFDPEVEEEVIVPQGRRGPVRLAFSCPSPGVQESVVDIDVGFHGFRAFGGDLRIEAWAATRSTGEGAVDAIRLVVSTTDGTVLDRVTAPVDDAHRRRELVQSLTGSASTLDGWIHGFGVLLPSGEYLAVVDALDAEGNVVTSRDARLRLDPRVVAVRAFDISEPMICDGYSELGRYGGIPSEFVRYARAVVPNPTRTIPAGTRDMAVYYEVYGATVDATARARLDVEYSIYDAHTFDPVLRTASYVDGQIALPRSRLVFPDLRSGVADGGLIIRGTRLDVARLGPGFYVLSVLVSDTIARRETERTVVFEVLPPAE